MPSKPLFLIGAGGHAKVVAAALASQGKAITAYVDDNPASWLDSQHIPHISEAQLEAQLGTNPELVIGFVGLTLEALERRSQCMRDYQAKGAIFPSITHASAIIGSPVSLGAGVQILAGAVVNPYAIIKDGAVINSAAVIEHDAIIGAGSHIAPRAVVLGGAILGEHCFIGANAVIIQGVKVEQKTFVKALSLRK